MSIFEKLNLKDHRQIVVLNSPESFEPELAALDGVRVIRELKDAGDAAFFLTFVTKQKEVDTLGKAVAKQATGDAVVWFAYPKGTSKKYKSEISRDNGWTVMGEAGFEPVRLVALDMDWSAFRLRRAAFIKTMKRGVEHRMSAEGRAKAARK